MMRVRSMAAFSLRLSREGYSGAGTWTTPGEVVMIIDWSVMKRGRCCRDGGWFGYCEGGDESVGECAAIAAVICARRRGGVRLLAGSAGRRGPQAGRLNGAHARDELRV